MKEGQQKFWMGLSKLVPWLIATLITVGVVISSLFVLLHNVS